MSPARRASAGQIEVLGNDYVDHAGAGNYADSGVPGSYVIVANKPGGLAWALYQVPGFEAERPVSLNCGVTAAPIVPGGDEDLPLSYWVGVGNYTRFAWEWHGPFTGAGNVTLNSASIFDRYVSAGAVFTYVIATAAGAKFAGPGNPDGLTAARIERCTITTLSANDAAYTNTRPHFPQILSPGKGGSALDPPGSTSR